VSDSPPRQHEVTVARAVRDAAVSPAAGRLPLGRHGTLEVTVTPEGATEITLRARWWCGRVLSGLIALAVLVVAFGLIVLFGGSNADALLPYVGFALIALALVTLIWLGASWLTRGVMHLAGYWLSGEGIVITPEQWTVCPRNRFHRLKRLPLADVDEAALIGRGQTLAIRTGPRWVKVAATGTTAERARVRDALQAILAERAAR